MATTPAALRRRFCSSERYRVVLEAGIHSPWMSRLLIDLGHEVYVANPRRLRAIYENESMSDRMDAEYLARIGRLDPDSHLGSSSDGRLLAIFTSTGYLIPLFIAPSFQRLEPSGKPGRFPRFRLCTPHTAYPGKMGM